MQLHHAPRQLLLRCSLRYYSVSAVSGKSSVSTPDAVAASGTSVPSRIRRPSASSFGGISIENVVIPTQSQGLRNRPNRPSQADGPKTSNTPRTNQQERPRAAGKHAGSGMSGWGDGLVSLSFSSRLRMRHEKKTKQNTEAHPEAQEGQQQSKPRQRAESQGQGRQQEQRGAATSHTPRSRDRQNSANTTRRPSDDANPRPASMTRSPTSRHASPSATAPKKKASPPSDAAAKAAVASTTTAERAARLVALSSTDLNALFRTRDTPVAGTPLPAYASTTARVRSVLERSAGDYSRFLPRRVGVRKSVSPPPALCTARHALAARRDVSLAQRRVALHIIGGLAQPRRRVRRE